MKGLDFWLMSTFSQGGVKQSSTQGGQQVGPPAVGGFLDRECRYKSVVTQFLMMLDWRRSHTLTGIFLPYQRNSMYI